jgi:lysyl-tRNA synthetase, class II
MSQRSFGKAAFLHIQDATEQIQVFVQRDAIGPEKYALFKKLDIGDIVGVIGGLFRTKTGELTIKAEMRDLVSKSLRPCPKNITA